MYQFSLEKLGELLSFSGPVVCVSLDEEGRVKEFTGPPAWLDGLHSGDDFEQWHQCRSHLQVQRVTDGEEHVLALRNPAATPHATATTAASWIKADTALQVLGHAEQLSAIGCFDWDIQQNHIRWTDGLFRIFGLEPQSFEATLEAFLERVVPEDHAQVLAAIQNAIACRGAYESVERIIHASGEVRTLESRGQVLVDESGHPQRLIGVCRDVSQRVASERKQAWQIDGLKLLATSASAIMRDEREANWAPVFSTLAAHLNCDAFANYRFEDRHLHLEVCQGFPPEVESALMRLKEGQLLCGVCAQNREILYVPEAELKSHPEATSLSAIGIKAFVGVPLILGEQLLGVLSFASRWRSEFDTWELDFLSTVAQLVAAAKSQRRARTVSRLVLKNTQMVSWEGSLNLDLTFVSGACEKMLGFSQADWTQKGFWRSRMSPEDAREVEANLSFAPESQRLEFSMRHRDGQQVWIEALVEIADEESSVPPVTRPPRLRGVFSNITERRRLEEQLRYSQKMEAVGRLAGGVAHDFNNLLTVIRTYAELLSWNADESNREAVKAIEDAARRASNLTSQLMIFGRNAQRNERIFDINEAISGSLPLLQRLLGDTVVVDADLASDLPYVKLDASHLDQVLVNLVVNAKDAMPHGGNLTLVTRERQVLGEHAGLYDIPPGKYIELRVSDSGTGMTQDTQARAFEPFFTTKEVGKGTGLGLAVVYGVVKDCGGGIGVTSSSKGTTFEILFPCSHEAPLTEEKNVPTPERLARETILLVEDEDIVLRATSAALRANGYTVLEASSATEALRLSQSSEQPISLLLTDVVMPEMSGIELAQSMHNKMPGMRIICMSGHLEESQAVSGDAFLQKPFTLRELTEKVGLVLDHKQQTPVDLGQTSYRNSPHRPGDPDSSASTISENPN